MCLTSKDDSCIPSSLWVMKKNVKNVIIASVLPYSWHSWQSRGLPPSADLGWCPGGVLVVSRVVSWWCPGWCPGGVLVVSPVVSRVVSWWCPGWCPGGVPRGVPGGVRVVSWWCPGWCPSGWGWGMAGLLQRAVLQARRWLKVDVLREVGRQYPLFCCVLSAMLLLTVLLNRYTGVTHDFMTQRTLVSINSLYNQLFVSPKIYVWGTFYQ